MDAMKVIMKRLSVRRYKTKSVTDELIEQLAEAGRHAPSARGIQPWEFVVVKKKDVLTKIGKLTTNGSFIKDAACCILVFCRPTKYYLEDGSAATENILLAATALGLGACWVAGDKKAYCADVARLVKAPEELKLVSLISVGWPVSEQTRIKRRELKDILHWGTF